MHGEVSCDRDMDCPASWPEAKLCTESVSIESCSGSELLIMVSSQAQANCRVGIAALNTLAGYIDWVAMSHITADNCKLLEMLCLLLNEPELQVGAAECLLIAVSRKVSSSS